MKEKILLRVFWMAMLLCASSALIGIWFLEGEETEFFKLIPTFFIIGLASFLLWAPIITYRFLNK